MSSYISLTSGHKVWFKISGNGKGLPLLVLHGGPGAGHDYLENLAALGDSRPVIFYDQLGCGQSDKPDDNALWTISRFADEIDEVRRALDLEKLHLIGQSFGGWLAIEYLIRQPKGIACTVLASTSASIPQFVGECAKWISLMPADAQEALRIHGASADYQHPDFLVAVDIFNRRHLCRLDPWPDCIMRTGANIAASKTYSYMNGPNEFTITGNLKNWDRTSEIGSIKTPVLLTCGEFDELSPACSQTLLEHLPNAQMKVFANCSHVAHLEAEQEYLQTIADFLKVHDP